MILRWFKAWRASRVASTRTRKSIRLHLRVFYTTQYPIATMLNNARSLLSVIDIHEQSYLRVNDRTHLQVVEFNSKSDMDEIDAREGVTNDKEIVVYFINATVDPFNGASAPATKKPWIIITTSTSEWTLAHELGHVLGLDDVSDTDRLMTAAGTHAITNPPPDLEQSEKDKILQSNLLY